MNFLFFTEKKNNEAKMERKRKMIDPKDCKTVASSVQIVREEAAKGVVGRSWTYNMQEIDL